MTELNTYLVDIVVRVLAEDQEQAFYLVNERALRAFSEALIEVSEPELQDDENE